MKLIQEKLSAHLKELTHQINSITASNGDDIISHVSLAQAFGGIRGVKCIFCNTSLVKPTEGLFIQGHAVQSLISYLPEEIFILLLTGSLPTKAELKEFQNEINIYSKLPDYVVDILKAMPKDSHPMAMFSGAILAMERESVFAKKYTEGIPKDDHWKYTLIDGVRLMAVAPSLAAAVFQIKFRNGDIIPYNPKLDWGTNFAKMLGIADPSNEFAQLIRLYLVLHCDHEGGAASANANKIIDSTLSDVYYSVCGGLNALAGPLHGLANQEVLKFILAIQEKYKGAPTSDQIKEYTNQLLSGGRVIPGFGHAVLRITDPRFDCFYEFGKTHCKESTMFKIVETLFQIVPQVLIEQGKAANPWPNVDCISGSLLYHYGLTEYSFYTVLFGVSRVMGLLAQSIQNRGLRTPITRPKSFGLQWIEENVRNKY